jgi:hypothetical protein
MGPGLFVYSASQLWRELACLSLDGNGLDATGANPRRERTCLCKVSYEVLRSHLGAANQANATHLEVLRV